MKTMHLQCEQLEPRNLPSSVSLAGGVLTVTITGKGTHTLSVDTVNAQTQVSLDGRVSAYDGVASLVLNGSQAGKNVIQNNTALDSVINGGQEDDVIFGGSGRNTIDSGDDPDVVYALLGTNTISVGDDGSIDRVFTNFGAAVSAGRRDIITRFFGPGRTPGTPFIGFDPSLNDGVLYITPSNNGSSVLISQGSRSDSVSVTYDLGDGNGTQTASFAGVKSIAYFGGLGNDSYENDSKVSEAAYGSAGDDTLTGGFGRYTLLKGSSGNDVLRGRARSNDLSGNAGVDQLFAEAGKRNIFRAGPEDRVFGFRSGDVRLYS